MKSGAHPARIQHLGSAAAGDAHLFAAHLSWEGTFLRQVRFYIPGTRPWIARHINHIDDDHRDVVPPARVVGGRDQRSTCQFRVGLLAR